MYELKLTPQQMGLIDWLVNVTLYDIQQTGKNDAELAALQKILKEVKPKRA